MTPETKVKNEILKYLQQLDDENEPIFYERRQAGGFSYKKGIPDIYLVYYGLHIEVEIKAENGETSIMQDKFAEKCKKKQICYICVKSVEEVKYYLNYIKVHTIWSHWRQPEF